MHTQWIRVRLIEILLAGVISGLMPSVVAQTLTGVTGLPNQHAVTNLASLTPVTDAGSGTPATPTNFLAVADNGTQDPPFPGGAVGTNHIVSTLDSIIRVQSRTGTNLYTVGLTNFWAAAGPYADPRGPFDPKVVYDPYNNRWMMTAVANYNLNSAAVLVGVTQTGDPTGAWNLYRVDINTNSLAPQWANYPSIGFNKDWIVIAVTAFPNTGSSASEEWQLYAFSKTNLYANGNGRFTRWGNSDLPTFHTVQEPCATYDNVVSNLYLVADMTDEGGNGSLRLFYIDGPVRSEVLHVGPNASSSSPWSPTSPVFDFAPQLGSTNKIALDDSRLQNAVYRNGSIWTTHTIFLPAVGSATRSALQWWQIHPDGSIVQRGRIEDVTGQIFYGYPSIAVNQLNDAFIGCARFSASNYPSAYYALRSHLDPTNTVQTPVLLKAGDTPYTRSDRWGDHTSTVTDPANDLDFWTIQEYATSTNSQSRWGTWWGKVVGAFVDLSLTKTASQSPTIIGSNLTYTITVTNLTAVPAASVTVTDPLPASVTFLSVSASQGTCTNVNGTVICSLSTIASNAAASVQIVVVPTALGALTNVAGVTAATSDTNLANNSMTNIVTVTPPPHLSVTPVSQDFGVLTVGQTSTQTFSIVNSGGGSLIGTAAVIGVAFVLASVSNFNLLGGQTNVVSVSFNPGTAGSFTGSAVFASNGGNSTNALSGTGANAPTADLAMTQTAAPNPVFTSQNLTYILMVTNLGPSAASSVTVTDALPTGFSFVSASISQGICSNAGGVVTCSLGSLSTNALATMAITATPSASSNVTNIINTATVTATEFDPATTNNTASISVVVYRDADNDGIPDYWTQLYFGHGTGQAGDSSRAGDDADGDGYSNLQEYLAGTSPVDVGSALRIIAVEANETNIVVSFSSVTNKLYRLEWSDDVSGPWTNSVPPDMAGTGNAIQTLDVGEATRPQRYYRVRLLP